MSENVIEVCNVSKKYSDFTLDNIGFNIKKGGICGFVGQNGAGKTTTIKILLDIINRDCGEVKVFGEDICKNAKMIKDKIGVVFDEMGFHDFMTPKQLNKMFKNIYGKWNEAEFFEYLKRFSLPANKRCGDYSRGMRMKLQIAVAMSHNADLLIMDEPTSGLDPIVRSEILQIFQEYVMDENHTILFSSHITSDLERVADEVIFINGGKILLTGNKDELLENYGIVKCNKEQLKAMDMQDVISVRSSTFCEEVMINNKQSFKSKYKDLVVDDASLEDILIFSVLR